MRKWIRFNARNAVRTGDGLYGAVLRIPEHGGRYVAMLGVGDDVQREQKAKAASVGSIRKES
jgi:hypothetical protein